MNETYTAEQRRLLADGVASGARPLHCPACGAVLSVSRVQPGKRISYVRHRVLVVCPSCRRSAAVDQDERRRSV